MEKCRKNLPVRSLPPPPSLTANLMDLQINLCVFRQEKGAVESDDGVQLVQDDLDDPTEEQATAIASVSGAQIALDPSGE